MQKEFLVKKELFIQEIYQDINNYYQIDQKEIGKGAFGKVFIGKDKSKPKTIRAIKKILKNYKTSFIHSQISLLKQLDHPNVLRLYDIYHDKMNIYLVTDYFQGGDLFQKLQQHGQFTQQQAKNIFVQALEAISYCHSQKIMHRDIKPQNLMFLNKKSMNLKLIDFGLAFKWDKDARSQTKKSGHVAGSAYYMSPELISNNYNEKCDIWSLGILLYILVTAQFPFEGPNQAEIFNSIKSFKIQTKIEDIKVSDQLKDLLRKLLSKEILRPSASQIFKHPWLNNKQNLSSIKVNFNKIANFSKFSKIKTLAITYIASQMSQKEIQKLSNLFKQIDINHDGYLTLEQFKIAFQRQKQKSSLLQLSKMLSFIDTDKNGKINYTQFITCCLQNSVVFKQQNLKAAFKMIDKDGNGKIQIGQLKQLLKQNYNNEDLQQIIRVCDKNKDGFIDYKEFVENISKH